MKEPPSAESPIVTASLAKVANAPAAFVPSCVAPTPSLLTIKLPLPSVSIVTSSICSLSASRVPVIVAVSKLIADAVTVPDTVALVNVALSAVNAPAGVTLNGALPKVALPR